ncbi:MAG: glyceraldehyde-3-phosphate ferredoxin oxidoreductase [Candidatus Odinarchaeota archaeon]|nr:glyceraldehyde-3-phosphate ferredoxin oxidoreductase [Candidatus Odinarchaeota archaeon]
MSLKYKILYINASTGKFRVEESENDVLGPLDAGIKLHLDIYESYKYDVYDSHNVLLVGKGVFAGSMFYGSHRLIAVFRSPLTRGLHVSAVGGAAYSFMRTGVDAICIEGKSELPSLIFVKGDQNGKVDVNIITLEERKLWDIYTGYKNFKGTEALAYYIIDNYWDFIGENRARMILVGPAAAKTSLAGLYAPSLDYNQRRILVEDWAARGGGGSVLLRSHGIAGIIGGGQYQPRFPLKDISKFIVADSIIAEVLDSSYIESLRLSTNKYHYAHEYRAGGTFGSNYPHYQDKVPLFNWKMIYLSKEERKKLFNILMEYFHKPFKKEAIDTGNWFTCGEPCPVKCKKVRQGKHVDYEPYHGAGPMIGVFDIYEADRVIREIDSAGLDAIETGNILGWIFELLEKDLLKPEEVGIDAKPYFDPQNYDVKYSKHNAQLAVKLINEIIRGDNSILGLVMDNGLRAAAKKLDEMFKDRIEQQNIRFEDVAVYVPYGENGHITPNYYWTPGMIAPLYVLGRYWTYYANVFSDPELFASVALDRAVKEYAMDNAGWCRFHRRLAEGLLSKLYREVYGLNIDPFEHAKKYYKLLVEYQRKANALPTFWDSKRLLELMKSAACEFESEEWCKQFTSNLEKSAKEWWSRFTKKVEELLAI